MTKRIFRVVQARTFLVFTLMFMSAGELPAQAGKPLPVYSGDGLTVVITELSEASGVIAGQLRRGQDAFPFTGKMSEEGGVDVVRGTFTVGNDKYDFTSRQEAGSEVVNFTTGGTTYHLRPAEACPGQSTEWEYGSECSDTGESNWE